MYFNIYCNESVLENLHTHTHARIEICVYSIPKQDEHFFQYFILFVYFIRFNLFSVLKENIIHSKVKEMKIECLMDKM